MTEEQKRDAIQISNFQYISGKKLEMGYEEKNGEAILRGIDEDGTQYTLAVINIPKEPLKVEKG